MKARIRGVAAVMESFEYFCLFWDLLKKRAAELDIDDPKLPRRRKQPKRYDENSSTSSFHLQ